MYARVTFSQVSPDRIDEAVSLLRDSLVPAARQQKGFKGYLLLGDRAVGKGISISMWETESDRAASDQPSEYYREVTARIAPFFTAQPVVENYEVNINE
jgi:quinol monooxygenase YgiN